MPLMALLMGCACDDGEALSPVLTVEGGGINVPAKDGEEANLLHQFHLAVIELVHVTVDAA